MEPASERIAIRRASANEVEAIRACLAEAFAAFRALYTLEAYQDTVPPPAGMRKRMSDMTVYIASTAEGEIVGTISYGMDRAKTAHLRGMAVRPAWQGHGIAEQLLRTAENDLLAAGCVLVSLHTTAPLERAIRFYQKHGFVPSGKIEDFFGMPLYEYVKSLA
jgi:ribosomal protein S18 acetylase RimI-like enzyme